MACDTFGKDTAIKIKARGWRQGAILLVDNRSELYTSKTLPYEGRYIVISQSCDVVYIPKALQEANIARNT